jgi:peptidoglycan/LPS O-acetylase OafA/YrhL
MPEDAAAGHEAAPGTRGSPDHEIPGTRGSAGHEVYLGTGYFPSLDGLRCLSVVPVIWHHSQSGPVAGVLGRGPLGVDLFFAISGFLITTRLLREQRSTGGVSIRAFYARRALRIWPLYYAILGLSALRALVWLPASPTRDQFLHGLPFWATFTANWFIDFLVPHPIIFGFAWSLSAEEQYYLLWPWVIRAARRWWLPLSIAAVLLGADQAVEWGYVTGMLPPGGLARRVVANIASPICLGSMLAILFHEPRTFALGRGLLGQRASAPLLLTLLGVLLCSDGVPQVVMQLLMALLVSACCIRGDHGLAWLTDLRPLRWVGTISYGMYMLHIAMITLARGVLPGSCQAAGVFALAFGCTTLLAALSHRFFEGPFLRQGRRLQRS